MDKKISNIILRSKNNFVPYIFTERQFEIIKKHQNNDSLSQTEKTYLYTSIKKKMDALSLLKEEFYINGRNMLHDRVEKAKYILRSINKQAFISGSFLFKKKFNDIDIYVISKRRKQYTKGKNNFVHITTSDLNKPIFASAALYSVSNFELPRIKVPRKRYGFTNTIMAYQISIKEYLEKEGFKTLKYLLMEYYLVVKNKILDSYELTFEYERITRSVKAIEEINIMIKKLLLKSYSNRYLYDELVRFSKWLGEDIKSYKANDNLIIYKEVFDEIKNECKRAET